MTKLKTDTPNLALQPQYSFYRPHKRFYSDINPETGELVDKVSMTKQEFAKECDINNIIKSFQPSTMHMLLQQYVAAGRFEDLPDQVDYQESLNILMEADRAFQDIPSKVRDRFGNDPAQFLAFMANPENEKEARELGLLKPKAEPPPPMEVRVVNPPEDQAPPPAPQGAP